MTKNELFEALDAEGIDYNPNDKKAVLEALLNGDDANVAMSDVTAVFVGNGKDDPTKFMAWGVEWVKDQPRLAPVASLPSVQKNSHYEVVED